MAENLVDALYSRFLLRDVFGKIIPGLALLLTLGIVLISPDDCKPETCRDIIMRLPFGVWIAIFGAAWIVAFAVQSIGEWTKLIRYYPKTYKEDQEWYRLTARFRTHDDYNIHNQQYERIVVIKEACGNAYVSLLLSAAIWLLDRLWVNWDTLQVSVQTGFEELIDHIVIVIVVVGVIVFLRRMHFKHVERGADFLQSVVNRDDPT